MKKILFGLALALFAPACTSTPSQGGAVESPQTTVEASPLTSSPTPLDAECDQACNDAFETCLGNATSDVDACQCDNARILCGHRCGHGGALHPCF
ncbi:MAG TPA: hypothetical protein VK601_07650 [Kofleriaceae bacterium]|nr:hypothetical protein [Kofleriaceae bacterium]